MGNLNIRDKIRDITFKMCWIADQAKKLRNNPELAFLSDKELTEYLFKKYDERRLVNGRLYNNANNENLIMNQEQFINKYLNSDYILSGYACFYENQDNVINVSSAALENLGDMRKVYKKKMEESTHGSSEYIYYKILQLTYKLLMNSFYRNPRRKKFSIL